MRRYSMVPLLAIVAFLLVAPLQLRADGLDSFTIVSAPEPSSILLLLTGFLAVAGALAVKRAAA